MRLFLNYRGKIFLIKTKIKTLLVIIFKKKILMLIFKDKIKINKNYALINLKMINKQENTISFFKKIKKIIKNYNNVSINKLNFSGKGFKIKKIKKICTFLLNTSHPIYIVEKTLNI
jgi:hypothetical protein